MNVDTKSLVYIGLFSALIAIGAFIKITFLIVPITLQTLFVVSAGLILNKKEALYSVLLYLFIGLIGIPVFARGGGLNYIYQPTFGYLIGFMLCVIFIGQFKEKIDNKLVLSLIGMLIIYVMGMIYFAFIQYTIHQKSYELNWIIFNLFLIFLPGDILSCIVATEVSKRVKIKRN